MDKVEHRDLALLLADLAAKGYRPEQLDVVQEEWEAACRLGAHPDLGAAVRDLPEVEGRTPST